MGELQNIEKQIRRHEMNIVSILDHLDMLLPTEFGINDLAQRCNKHRDTIAKHLKQHYVDGVDYWYSTKGGKIWVARGAAMRIKDHYGSKKR